MSERIRWVRFMFWLVSGVLRWSARCLPGAAPKNFLIKDDRFRVAEAEELNGQSPNLIVEGIQYASASQIRHVFRAGLWPQSLPGPNPEAPRSSSWRSIGWRSAAVSKIWPNTLKVRVTRARASCICAPCARTGRMECPNSP